MNLIIHDYCSRKRLASLGFTSDLALLSADNADAFIAIDLKLQEIQQEKAKKGKRNV